MSADYTHCIALVREADRDRYLSTLFAPAQHRDALAALYAFNVEIARVREVAREPMPGEIRLQWWREVLGGARDGEAAAHPVAAALQETRARYALAPERLIGLIDAHGFDLYDAPMAMLDDLDRYGKETEAAVFAAAAHILGVDGEAITEHAGLAYALTRILMEFGRHAAQRRLYVPLEVLERHGVEREDVFARAAIPALDAALAELRRHARRYLDAAQAELERADPRLLPALLPAASAAAQLRRMERPGADPFAPPVLSAWRRQWRMWRAARSPRRMFTA
jgi:phytoene synthase